jgi:hypothetical protein
MDCVYQSRKMVCSARLEESSLRSWNLCTGLEEWYVAQDRKKVVSVHGICVLV